MEIFLKVKNFGKIQDATISLNKFTIFTGENNSGKTYLMQLIYAVINYLYRTETWFDIASELTTHNMENFLNKDSVVYVNSSNFHIIQKHINLWLENKKEDIISQTFNKNISIDKLELSFDNIDIDYVFKELPNTINDENHEKILYDYTVHNLITTEKNKLLSIHLHKSLKYINRLKFIFFSILQYISNMHFLNINKISFFNNNKPAVFFPASRTGLLMVYNNLFATNPDTPSDFIQNEDVIVSEHSNPLGVTSPVYDFLHFLQTYKPNELKFNDNSSLLNFINEEIINGKINTLNNNISYTPKNSETTYPLYLTSSLINEIIPITQVLTGNNNIKYILWDEVESCIHPIKQIQVARLLFRLVNENYRLIISTHSDTMASAINNLLLLSSSAHLDKKLKKLNYSNKDVLSNTNVNIYQFTTHEGKTLITKLENHSSLGIGYDFSLFYNATKQLYDEAQIILEGEDF